MLAALLQANGQPSNDLPAPTNGSSTASKTLLESAAVQTFGLSFVGLLTAACVYFKRRLTKKTRELSQANETIHEKKKELSEAPKVFEDKLKSDVQVPADAKKNSIMVIGLGGSGKTSVVNSICDPQLAGKEEETKEYVTQSIILTAQGTNYHLYACDYRGQDFGTLISSFIRQQLTVSTPMRFGFINTLIVVVDLIDPKQHLGPDGKTPLVDERGHALQFPALNEARVRGEHGHLTQWNRTALDAVFGLHSRDSLNYVCLFSNKANMIDGMTKEKRETILDAFKTLSGELKRRCSFTDKKTNLKKPYAYFETRLGNAHELPASLIGNLQKFSVPHNQDYVGVDEQ